MSRMQQNDDARLVEKRIKITSGSHLILLGQAIQALELVAVLKTAVEGPLGKLPGMAVAVALAEKEAAELRLAMVGRNMAAMTKAGVDVATHQVAVSGDGHLICTARDLVDQAKAD